MWKNNIGLYSMSILFVYRSARQRELNDVEGEMEYHMRSRTFQGRRLSQTYIKYSGIAMATIADERREYSFDIIETDVAEEIRSPTIATSFMML